MPERKFGMDFALMARGATRTHSDAGQNANTRICFLRCVNWSCHGCLMMDIMRRDAPLCACVDIADANTIFFYFPQNDRTAHVHRTPHTNLLLPRLWCVYIFATIHLLKVFAFFRLVLFCFVYFRIAVDNAVTHIL